MNNSKSLLFKLFLWINRIHESIWKWASKRRVRLVRLIPFDFTRIKSDEGPKPDLSSVKEISDTFIRAVEAEFYDFISLEPQAVHIISRYFIGYFRAEIDGIEIPNADTLLMWHIASHNSHLSGLVHGYIFFVDDQYYVGDVTYDKRPEWAKKNGSSAGESFHIRLLFKVIERG